MHIDGLTRVASGLVFGEGPRWHEDRLWVSDFGAKTVFTVSRQGSLETMYRFDDSPSGLGFLPDGSLLVALLRRKELVRCKDRKQVVHARLGDFRGDWLNDMVVAANGRAYVDLRNDYPAGAERRPDESVLIVEPDGEARLGAEGMSGPNGLCITADGTRLLVAETHGARVTSFDLAASGDMERRAVFAPAPGAHPDGMCLDADGAIWTGSYIDGEFLRIAEGGQVLDRIDVAPYWGVACMLGGEDRRTLFLIVTQVPVNRESWSSLLDVSKFRGESSPEMVSELKSMGYASHIFSRRVDAGGVGRP